MGTCTGQREQSTTCSATARSPPTPTGASTRCARSRTSPSPASPIASLPDPDRRARRGQAGGGPGQPRARAARRRRGRRHRRAPARRSAPGRCTTQFVVDVIQGGAGTSTNMNANEVIANRALELLGHAARRLPAPAPQRARQPRPVAPTTSTRRRSSSRPCFAIRSAARRDGRCCEAAFAAKAAEFARRAEDGPHPAAGRRADDPRPGVRHLRRDARRGPRPARARPCC